MSWFKRRSSTAAYHDQNAEAPRHHPERRHVKDLLTSHWDIDSLSREELEALLTPRQPACKKRFWQR